MRSVHDRPTHSPGQHPFLAPQDASGLIPEEHSRSTYRHAPPTTVLRPSRRLSTQKQLPEAETGQDLAASPFRATDTRQGVGRSSKKSRTRDRRPIGVRTYTYVPAKPPTRRHRFLPPFAIFGGRCYLPGQAVYPFRFLTPLFSNCPSPFRGRSSLRRGRRRRRGVGRSPLR